MNNQDFTATISVEKTPEQAFDSINNVRGCPGVSLFPSPHPYPPFV
jgi:hypothetical protein